MTAHLSESLAFEHYTAPQARELREVVEDIYRRSYVEAIASGDPFDSPTEFMHRFDAYTDPARGNGFELVLARVNGQPAGQAWGWPLAPDTPWWEISQLEENGDLAEFTVETGSRTFALSEIMVCLEHQGRGIARALHDELLQGRREQRATLLVESKNTRAYRAYTRWGWRRAGTMVPPWPSAPQFDVLIRGLP
ncbi:GNAT family N-acetyltransferase [Nocardia terpenica]|uniref:Acetyltransferase n=1 Tax=Nocardia terpenica TaxID=455432 RepID=A0A164JUP3_9NOCA|nr:GNAT family N-acetyltransferase [Nocardia terpenica]KZM70737.1 acetyltransferase [Nocardia terpenica]NQE89998.1 GNAT family N-acetyltransferase [Nocardia terpenica]